ncbi:MAG: dihydroneopterin aldolase [Microbacteriaceae bacterium]
MNFTDTISLTGISAFGRHGVHADERENGQTFIVDLTMHLNTAPAAESDEVTDTVHYGEVAERIVAVVEGEPVNLLETLAARIADDLLGAYPLLNLVQVTVHKPAAPIPVPFTDVAVTILRGGHHVPPTRVVGQ